MRVCAYIFIVSGFSSGHFCAQTDVSCLLLLLLLFLFCLKESLMYHLYYIIYVSFNRKISKGALRI